MGVGTEGVGTEVSPLTSGDPPQGQTTMWGQVHCQQA